MEDSLRDDIERLEALGKTPDDFALRVMRAMNVRPTSDVKMQNVRISLQLRFDHTTQTGEVPLRQRSPTEGQSDACGIYAEQSGPRNDATRVGGSWLWKGVA